MKSFADLGGPVTADELQIAAESSYRRGFYQGVAAGLEAAEMGYPFSKLRKWQDRLLRWRHKRHQGKFEVPEWLGRPLGA